MYISYWQFEDFPPFKGKVSVALSKTLTFFVGGNNSGKTRLAQTILREEGPGSCSAVFDFEDSDTLGRCASSRESSYQDEATVAVAKGFSGKDVNLWAYVTPTKLGRFGDEVNGRFMTKVGEGLTLELASGTLRSAGDLISSEFNGEVVELVQSHAVMPFCLPSVRASHVSSKELDVKRELAPDGSNLADVCLWLQTQDKHVWNAICDSLLEIVPSIGELIVKVAGTQLAIVARKGSVELNLKELGSGVEQLLLVAVACESQVGHRMVIIDEPEIGIHPTAQRTLMKHLRRWAEKRQIIVVTHSATIIEPSEAHPGERVYVVRENDDAGGSVVDECDSNFWSALSELGVEPTDGFAATRILFVEGPTEVGCFETWFPDLVTKPWFRMIDLEGCTKATTSVEAIEKLETVGSAQICAILDADEGERKSTKSIKILERRELENYFLDHPETVLEVLKKDGASGSTALGDVENAIAKAIDELKDEVIFLRARQRLAPSKNQRKAQLLQSKNGNTSHDKAELLRRVVAQRAATTDDEVAEKAWTDVTAEIESSWDTKRLELVRGSSVLEQVWKHFCANSSYDKKKTGPRLAAALSGPPKEIRNLVDDFVANGSRP
jgi:energy-coupling factor transporter ATP-binding protein EcfA2